MKTPPSKIRNTIYGSFLLSWTLQLALPDVAWHVCVTHLGFVLGLVIANALGGKPNEAT